MRLTASCITTRGMGPLTRSLQGLSSTTRANRSRPVGGTMMGMAAQIYSWSEQSPAPPPFPNPDAGLSPLATFSP
jgi:hypothetical protein